MNAVTSLLPGLVMWAFCRLSYERNMCRVGSIKHDSALSEDEEVHESATIARAQNPSIPSDRVFVAIAGIGSGLYRPH